MLKSQENNIEVLNFLNAKLVKNYSKLSKKTSKYEDRNENEVLNALEFGTKENNRVLATSFGVFGAPTALGISSALIGVISLIPTVNPAIDSNISQKLGMFGENAVLFGSATADKYISLLAIPVGVTAVSLSVKLYEMLKEKKINKKNDYVALISFINDVLDNKDDDTLDFSKHFFKRVDLSSNDPETNMNLVVYLAYHRMLLNEYKQGNVSEDEVDQAYSNIILYLEQLRDDKKESNNMKNNRFVNLLIDEYHEKEVEKSIWEGYKTR